MDSLDRRLILDTKWKCLINSVEDKMSCDLRKERLNFLQQLREPEKTNIPFYIPSSGRLCRPFNRKILNVALLRLRFCSIRDDKFDLNPCVKLGTSVYSDSLKQVLSTDTNTVIQ
ncbi:MAG: hypothetical protein WC156_00055 [Pedobacter sp.]